MLEFIMLYKIRVIKLSTTGTLYLKTFKLTDEHITRVAYTHIPEKKSKIIN